MKRTLLLLLFGLLVSLSHYTARGQQLKILKPEGAFKDASIGCGIKDKAGNLWFGSHEGVYRYNGKSFTHFTTKDGLDSNHVWSILEDKNGRIWFGTDKGACRYDGKTFSHIPITIATYGPSFNSTNSFNNNPSLKNSVWSMMQDRNGKIWFGTRDGVYCYDGVNFTNFLDNNNIINKDSLHLKAIFSIVEDKKGNIWFGSCIGEGLIKFDGKNLIRISPKGYARTQNIVEDKNGNIWFASIGKGMCRYDGKTINPNFFMEKDTYGLLYVIMKDKVDNLWFSEPCLNHTKTLRCYNGIENISFAEKNSLPEKIIYPVLEDNNGNIWFASIGMGLYRYDGKTFINFSEKEAKK